MKELFEKVKGTGELINRNGKLFLTNTKIRNFIYSGLFLGTERTPSTQVCYELSKTSFPRNVISNKAAEVFTHGKDVYERAVTRGQKRGVVLVMNGQGDCLGIGRWEEKTIKNLIDVGKFLR